MTRTTTRCQPEVERLEDRTAPALLASQLPLTTLPPLTLTTEQVNVLLQRAAAATGSDDAIIAVVDRAGNILGVRMEAGVSPAITSNVNIRNFAVDGAVSLARTAAFFSSDAAPLTSRTVQMISQSTITEREVNSYTFISDPNSTVGGPGFVAPIGRGGHFPPNVPNTPQVDLFGIEHTNRDMFVNPGPGSGGVLFTPGGGNPANNVGFAERFNIDPAFVAPGNRLSAPLSFHDTLLSPADRSNPAVPHVASRGIATLPGGIPLYEYGVLVGGIGVFFPGQTGFASESNSDVSLAFDPTRLDRAREAEFIALAAAGGSTGAEFQIGTLAGVTSLPGFDLPFTRIDLVGITLNGVGPEGTQGPQNLVNYARDNFSIGGGNPNSGTLLDVTPVAGTKFVAGSFAPDGWLVLPHDGVDITAQQVEQIISQGITEADLTRAQLRPLGSTTRMVFAVTDRAGEVVGLFRMPDAPVFSINVAVAKARNVAYYDDPAQLQPVDANIGLPRGASLTARTFRFLALPRFPEGIDPADPGPWSSLNDPGVDRNTAFNTGAPQPIASFNSIYGFDAFHPNTNFHQYSANASGVVFFPGSSGVYTGSQIIGGFGVSGDGVDQDDVVTAGGITGFGPPLSFQADRFFVNGVRLPYLKFNRNPRG